MSDFWKLYSWSQFLQISVKLLFGLCILLVNGCTYLLFLHHCPKQFKAPFSTANRQSTKVWSSRSICLCNSTHRPSYRNSSSEILISLVVFNCSINLVSSFHHFHHFNWRSASNIAAVMHFQSWGIILFWVAFNFNILFI